MKIGVVTTTRAEYGLLRALIREIHEDSESELCLIVTGTHLLEEYGNTIEFIEEDGFPIAAKIPVKIDTSSPSAVSETMGRYFFAFADFFEKNPLDFVVVLGDRYEMIPICYCAANAHIPIAHISGGEVTAGAIDDAVRHCLTKLSYLHFPACETYKNRIIQLGESPDRVFNVGDPGVECIKKVPYLSAQEVREGLHMKDAPYFAVIFHPVTLDKMAPEDQVAELLAALENFTDIQFAVMKANADVGGQRINERMEAFAQEHENFFLFSSLKSDAFLSLQKHSLGLIGNSSSGIVETPCFGIPTINIGDRQTGRLFADSIISCRIDRHEIEAAIKLALTDDFRMKAKNAENPYGSGDTSVEMLRVIKRTIKEGKINLKKGFYDIMG